jgi:ferredoxin
LKNEPVAWRKSGLVAASTRAGSPLVPFEEVDWRRLDGNDYFIARPVFEADLVINLPKLKTHMLTLYTGAIKNLFGVIPGSRKRELHLKAPGVQDFSSLLVDVLALVRPGLTIMDGLLGLEGNGPGLSGTPHWYGCLVASTDPVALDTVITRAMGYRRGEILHVAQAGARGLGVSDRDAISIRGDGGALTFGDLHLPRPHWYFRAPAWASTPLRRMTRLRPKLVDGACAACGKCTEACPQDVITPGDPPTFDLDRCIGCLCCAEVCPQGAIEPHRNLLARLIGMGY